MKEYKQIKNLNKFSYNEYSQTNAYSVTECAQASTVFNWITSVNCNIL